MIFQGAAANPYWKPQLNDPSQVTGASLSGIGNWYGTPLPSYSGPSNLAQPAGSNPTASSGSGVVAPLDGGVRGAGSVTQNFSNLSTYSPGFDNRVGNPAAPTNSANVESITQLVNEINQAAQQSANAGRIPGGAGLEGQSSANISSALSGQVDPSTLNLLGQQSAERGVSTGSPLGASNNAAYLKALGLTSLDRMNTGQNWLSQAEARNPAAPIYSAGNQVLTAEQQQQAILAREEMANRLRIAQMQAASRGGSGGGSGQPTHTGTAAPAGPATNWADLLFPKTPAAGWNFSPGYSNIPVGGTPSGNASDTSWEDYVFGIPSGMDTGGVGSTNDQFDYNLNDAFDSYA